MPVSVQHIPTSFTRRMVFQYPTREVLQTQRLHLTIICRRHRITEEIEYRTTSKTWLPERLEETVLDADGVPRTPTVADYYRGGGGRA